MVIADNRHSAVTRGLVAGQQNPGVQFEILRRIIRHIGTRHHLQHPVILPQKKAATLLISGSKRLFQKFVVMLP